MYYEFTDNLSEEELGEMAYLVQRKSGLPYRTYDRLFRKGKKKRRELEQIQNFI